jgi:hypothetical protein
MAIHWAEKHATGTWGPYLADTPTKMTEKTCMEACEKNSDCFGWAFRNGNPKHVHYEKCFLLDEKHVADFKEAFAKGHNDVFKTNDFTSGTCRGAGGKKTRSKMIVFPTGSHPTCSDKEMCNYPRDLVKKEDRACNAPARCDQECVVGAWDKWTHPDPSVPAAARDIWESNIKHCNEPRDGQNIAFAEAVVENNGVYKGSFKAYQGPFIWRGAKNYKSGCVSKCETTADCVAWTYNSDAKYCYLMGSTHTTREILAKAAAMAPHQKHRNVDSGTCNSVLQVQRVRKIEYEGTGGEACPATIEFRPWKDHCVMGGMGMEKNDRVCDMSTCKSEDDMVKCHHSADRCTENAYARVAVSYHKTYKCGDVGYKTKTCNRYLGRLQGKSLVHAECKVEDGMRYAASKKSAADAAAKVGTAEDPADVSGMCHGKSGTWGVVIDNRIVVASKAECRLACKEHNRCEAWTYKKDTGYCFRLAGEGNTDTVIQAALSQGAHFADYESGLC